MLQERLKVSDLVKIRYLSSNTTSDRLREFCHRLGTGRIAHPMALKVLQNAYEKLRIKLRGKRGWALEED